MKRLSKKLGFSGKYYPQGSWTKYDDRLCDGIDNNDVTKVKSAMKKKGVSCVKHNSNGSTALHRGCMQGQTNSVKIMLKAEKPDLTILDATGRTPMHVAAQGGHTDCMKYLIRYKSPLDIQDLSSMTPLHYCDIRILHNALSLEDVATLFTLLSLLINIVDGCYEETVSLLLKNGAPVNIKEKDGRTALALAAQAENENIIDLLCSHGAHLNSQDNSGRTALMYASEKGLRNVVGILLLKGADSAIKDYSQKTAADYAKAGGYIDLVEVLGAHMQNDCNVEAVNGTNETRGHDSISEYDSIIAEDSVTLNSSSSFGDMEAISESSPKSPNGFEFGMAGPFDLQKELQNLKTELKSETLKRTKAERELRNLRMQLEISQGSDEETPVDFDDQDCNLILSEIEKSIPSPLNKISSFEDEETPLVSSLRGEINALEIQIDGLKRELQEVKSDNNNETKIPLTVYKALKESHQKIYNEMNRNLEELQSELKSEKDSGAALAKENEALKERLNCYKETLEKNDRKEKIRDLNEQIVSLKIELSHVEHFKDENEELQAQMEISNIDKEAEIKRLKESLTRLETENMALAENHNKKISNYRRALLSAYQGNLDLRLGTILDEISRLRGFMTTEL